MKASRLFFLSTLLLLTLISTNISIVSAKGGGGHGGHGGGHGSGGAGKESGRGTHIRATVIIIVVMGGANGMD